MWDVDGTGMRKIEDPDLAKAFLEKINTLNTGVGRDILFASTVFALLPHDFTSSLALCITIITVLYAIGLDPEDNKKALYDEEPN